MGSFAIPYLLSLSSILYTSILYPLPSIFFGRRRRRRRGLCLGRRRRFRGRRRRSQCWRLYHRHWRGRLDRRGRRRWSWWDKMSTIRSFLLVLFQIHFVQFGSIDVATHQQINNRAGAPEITVTETEHQQEDDAQPDRDQEGAEFVGKAEYFSFLGLFIRPWIGGPIGTDMIQVIGVGIGIDNAVLHYFLTMNGGAFQEQCPPAERGRRVDKQVGRLSIGQGDEPVLRHAPLGQIHHQRPHEADKKHQHRAVGNGNEAIPEVVPRLLIDVTIRTADGLPAVGAFGADGGRHQRPAHQADQRNGHHQAADQHQPPQQAIPENVAEPRDQVRNAEQHHENQHNQNESQRE